MTEQDFEAAKHADEQGWCIARHSNASCIPDDNRWYVSPPDDTRHAAAATLHEAVEQMKAILNPPTITKDQIVDTILQAISDIQHGSSTVRTLNNLANKLRNSKVVD